MSLKGKPLKHVTWKDKFVKTESGWYVYYDETLDVTYVMDEKLVFHIDSLKARLQIDLLAKLFTEAGAAIGRNALLIHSYGIRT